MIQKTRRLVYGLRCTSDVDVNASRVRRTSSETLVAGAGVWNTAAKSLALLTAQLLQFMHVHPDASAQHSKEGQNKNMKQNNTETVWQIVHTEPRLEEAAAAAAAAKGVRVHSTSK